MTGFAPRWRAAGSFHGAAGLIALLAVWVLVAGSGAAAQDPAEISGDRLSGFVLPVEPQAAEVRLRALRGRAWDVDETRRLLLEGDVQVQVGSRHFSAASAVVWINRLPSGAGLINQMAIALEGAAAPAGPSGLVIEGRHLLVTASTRGEVLLDVALLEQAAPREHPAVLDAEARLAEYLGRVAAGAERLERSPRLLAAPPPPPFQPVPGGAIPPEPAAADPGPPGPEPLLRPRTVVRFSADRVEFAPGAEENAVLAMGGLVVEYLSRQPGAGVRQLTLSAERGVIFTRPGPLEDLARRNLDAETVHGVYLEGNVQVLAEDGEYAARSPQVYYDFGSSQAVMLDAVLRTYARQGDVPLYARAAELRQIAQDQWAAQRVVVSTSEFFTPHLALGAERMTITRRPRAGDPAARETHLVSDRNTLRAGDLAFLVWPRFSGTIRDLPLRRVSAGAGRNDGLRLNTRWDLWSLLGEERPAEVERTDLVVDGFTDRGAALGIDHRYAGPHGTGALDLYGMHDNGIDRTSGGRDVTPEREWRGLALWEHQAELRPGWSVQAQTAWISDPTFVSARREDDFRERREYETSLHLKGQGGGSAFAALLRHDLNDFISNDWLLASRQTRVERLPEFAYRRVGDALLGGRLTYTGDIRATRMRFVHHATTPRQVGVPGAAFGLGLDDRIDDALRAGGLSEDTVGRLDSRHELVLPLRLGPFNLAPFLVGRYTWYTDDFEAFSSDSGSARAFAAAGVRLSTSLQRVDNSVSSRLLDLHRLRHIIEPSLVLWYAHSDRATGSLPPYDPAIEPLTTGAAISVGVRNRWQTERGGPGRWRSVDWLVVDTSLVLSSDDADRQSPAPQFFDYRPEHSQPGDHLSGGAVWALTDGLTLAARHVIDLDDPRLARAALGAELQHTPGFSSHVEYRLLEASDNQILDLGWTYQLTPVYRMILSPQFDLRTDDFRAVHLSVVRSFPDVDFILRFTYDQVKSETSVGASLDLVRF